MKGDNVSLVSLFTGSFILAIEGQVQGLSVGMSPSQTHVRALSLSGLFGHMMSPPSCVVTGLITTRHERREHTRLGIWAGLQAPGAVDFTSTDETPHPHPLPPHRASALSWMSWSTPPAWAFLESGPWLVVVTAHLYRSISHAQVVYTSFCPHSSWSS